MGGEDQDRFGEHHSLGFSTIRFKVATRDSGGSLFVIEHEHLLKGGPPMHVHRHLDEWFYVMEGEVDFQVGREQKRLDPRESLLGPRDIVVPNGSKMDAAVFSRYEMRYVGPSPFAS